MWRFGCVVVLAAAGALCAAPLDQQDVEFARPGGTPLYVDLHVPDGPGPFPAFLLVHGGGFDGGSRKTNMRPLFDLLANAGYAWFSVDYRMAPDFRSPQAWADMQTAIRWVKANTAKYHLDPKVRADRRLGGRLPGELRGHAMSPIRR